MHLTSAETPASLIASLQGVEDRVELQVEAIIDKVYALTETSG